MRLHKLFVLLFVCCVMCRSGNAAHGRQTALSEFVQRSLAAQSVGGVSHRLVPRRLAQASCATNASICADPTLSPVGSACCGNSCVVLATDPNNCGQCQYLCGSSLGCCDGLCVDLQIDNSNCGSCGNICKGQTCESGMCGYSS